MFNFGGMGGLNSMRAPTMGMGGSSTGMGGSYLGGGGNMGGYQLAPGGGMDVMGTIGNINKGVGDAWKHPYASQGGNMGWGD